VPPEPTSFASAFDRTGRCRPFDLFGDPERSAFEKICVGNPADSGVVSGVPSIAEVAFPSDLLSTHQTVTPDEPS